MKTATILRNFYAPAKRRPLSFSKINALTVALIISLPFFSYGQKNAVDSGKGLAPARGNYKTFASLSSKPKSPNLDIDKLRFPFNQAQSDRALAVKPIYLQNTTVNDFKLPDPPANSSEQTRAELNYLLSLQHNRSAENILKSLYMSNNPPSPSSIGQTLGYWTAPQQLPLTDTLIAKVSRDGDFFLWSLKFKYERVRPYALEPKIHDLEESFASSYPSGHVTYAYIYAFIFQELAPEFADYFNTSAYNMARARQVIGVHYPSDCEGSRIFARQFVNMLFANESFRRDFENARKEWALKKEDSLKNTIGALKK